jgi:nucleoside-diphosphate-sugar epimerase
VNILLTGANGFIGSRLARVLNSIPEISLSSVVRRRVEISESYVFPVPSIEANTDWTHLLANQQVVIHTAARAHIIKEKAADPLAEYRRVNVEGTLNLARQAAAAGVKRFIFISSIGVNGNINTRPFTEWDTPNPAGLYAQSKWEAEQGLWGIQRETGIELVIIRPPLVYGPNAPGNFGSLIRWTEKGFPMPLGSIHNQRSLVALDNLVDLIITCITHPAAANQLFLAGDGKDLSTTELLRRLAQVSGKPSWLIPIPGSLLVFVATLLGKKVLAMRLLGSLQVDISKARDLLSWIPPISVEEGLRCCFNKD